MTRILPYYVGESGTPYYVSVGGVGGYLRQEWAKVLLDSQRKVRATVYPSTPPVIPESVADNQVRIIGVELAVTPTAYNGNPLAEIELEMFACRYTIPKGSYYSDRPTVRVTVHTSSGDVTMRGTLL